MAGIATRPELTDLRRGWTSVHGRLRRFLRSRIQSHAGRARPNRLTGLRRGPWRRVTSPREILALYRMKPRGSDGVLICIARWLVRCALNRKMENNEADF